MPTEAEERDARIALLEYFQRGHIVEDVARDGIIGAEDINVAEVVRALATAGLLRRVRGRTKGSVYLITETGHAALTILKRP